MSHDPPMTFNELIAELYTIPLDIHQRHRSNYVYRGVDVATWGLETSLQRLGQHHPDVEGPMLRNFTKYSVDRGLSSQPLFYKLAFAQHHGLPTRVLDWSTAPKIALHFAVGDENHYDKDGIIWAVDVVQARQLLPGSLIDILNKHRAFLFSIDMLSHIGNLDDLDAIGALTPFTMFFEPPSLDSRIVNQAAILSLMSGKNQNLKVFLLDHPEIFKQIVIRKELKWEIRDKLDQDQINERMLFPGEDGTARWLKRYYGPGSRRSAPAAFTGAMTGKSP